MGSLKFLISSSLFRRTQLRKGSNHSTFKEIDPLTIVQEYCALRSFPRILRRRADISAEQTC
jgi:hypothetical protein